ncbi:MAG: glycosyl hydrolase family 88 [Ruminococcaceae bacterium]|nr:glycosyl hydrolase family 88 [Oscillospiraceae bacterium]
MGIYERLINENREFIDSTWQKIEDKMSVVAPRNKDKLPYTTENGRYNDLADTIPEGWTNGFWPGMMWLMYASTKNEMYREVAESCEPLLERAADDYDLLHHDVGFMWHISSGINYRLTGNKKAKSRAMYMAASLASRYNLATGVIRAFPEERREKMVIIDSMMNIPLLYWASRETNDPRFSLIAQSHADTCIKNHMRSDGSFYHILNYNIRTGECEGPVKGQGTGIDSAWTRGQAWAIYGYALSYIHTGKQRYLDVAKNVANYFIACVSRTGYVSQYDFRQDPDCPDTDTSAAAIAACGFIEIAKIVPENEKATYLDAAIKIVKALTAEHCNWSLDEDSILQNVAEHSKSMEKPIVFGEYYYIEALYKLKGFEPLFW